MLQLHFKKEELLMQKVKDLNERLDTLVAEIFREHIELTEAFLSLHQSNNLEKSLHVLGEKLTDHIRKEERVLFPLIEESCTAAMLNELKYLHQ
jgi:iron-sulfur cluster repair protein YtfE (RIC family)